MTHRTTIVLSWALRILAAAIMLQTLYFKFTAAEESVYIFSALHLEPWGRIGTGVMELIASVLVLLPRTVVIGALLSVGIMAGAVLSHLFILGISVQHDGGQLFIYALIVLVCGVVLFWMHRRQLQNFLPARFIPRIFAVTLLFTTFSAHAQADKRQHSFNLSKSHLAIQGYDPVAYFTENKAIKGNSGLAAVHNGVTYYFSSQQNKSAFLASPAKYEPQYGGWCAYAMGASGEKVDIDPGTFKLLNGKLYLFYNKFFNNTLKSWNKDEKNLNAKADANWQKLFN